mmetsp:Transcript_13105/g.15266  ORF Transcript_13105/g.15266 Transcript_13105/m.15266 type:complete len:638 (+) Transcript_13105:330-2243(+)
MMWYSAITDLKRDLELDLTESANKFRRRVENTVLESAKGVKDSRLFRAYITYHCPDHDPFPYPYYRTQVRSNSAPNCTKRLLESHSILSGIVNGERSKNTHWEHGVNLARVSSQQELIEEESEEIGNVTIRLKAGRHLDVCNGKAFFVIELGSYRFVSPFVFEDEDGYFTWEIAVTLPIYDITSDIRILIYRSNFLLSDRLIGQVILPLVHFLPSVWTNKDKKSRSAKKLSGWFELFPLAETLRKFEPASSKVSGTGMLRPKRTLGKIHVEAQVHLKDTSIWPLYLSNSRFDSRQSLKDLQKTANVVQLLDKLKDIRRHTHRIEDAFLRIWDAVYVRAPISPPAFLVKLRSWDRPHINACVLLAVFFLSKNLEYCFSVLDFPVEILTDSVEFPRTWHLPFILYGVILSCSVHFRINKASTHKNHESSDALSLAKHDGETWSSNYGQVPLVWTDQTRDPDAHLTQFQKVGKLSRKLHLLEFWLRAFADILERIINAFLWVDERATLVLLGILCLFACVLSVVLHIGVEFWKQTTYPFILVCLLLFPAERIKRMLSSIHLSQFFSDGYSFKYQRYQFSSCGSSSIDRNLFQAVGCSTINLLSRIPTEDERSHRCIARMQRSSSSDFWEERKATTVVLVD